MTSRCTPRIATLSCSVAKKKTRLITASNAPDAPTPGFGNIRSCDKTSFLGVGRQVHYSHFRGAVKTGGAQGRLSHKPTHLCHAGAQRSRSAAGRAERNRSV